MSRLQMNRGFSVPRTVADLSRLVRHDLPGAAIARSRVEGGGWQASIGIEGATITRNGPTEFAALARAYCWAIDVARRP